MHLVAKSYIKAIQLLALERLRDSESEFSKSSSVVEEKGKKKKVRIVLPNQPPTHAQKRSPIFKNETNSIEKAITNFSPIKARRMSTKPG